MRTKQLIILTVIVIVGVLLISCTKQPPIKLGFSASLTGKLSVLGKDGRDGVILAVEELNQQGGIAGRKIELIVKDDQNSVQRARKVDKELISTGVSAIIGHMTSSMTEAVVPLMNEEEMLLISPTASTNQLTGRDDYFLRVESPNRSQQIYQAQNFINNLNLERTAVIYDLSNYEFSNNWFNSFKEEYTARGGEISGVVRFNSKQNYNYAELTEELLESKPEGVLLITGSIDAAMFSQQIRDLSSEVTIATTGWAMTDEFLARGGKAVEGVYLTSSSYKENRTRGYQDFKERFKERFNREVSFASLQAYQAAQVIFKASQRVETIRPTSLKEKIIELEEFQILQPPFMIDQYGDAYRMQYMLQVHEGSFNKVLTKYF